MPAKDLLRSRGDTRRAEPRPIIMAGLEPVIPATCFIKNLDAPVEPRA
ncbi:hypothetical protein [Siccirubricoccus deserti]|uniref:Uncharacterized protein n=1 Tax=Siccirubricoccus deserti TaxID=2013562 RepID=A0A9X0R0T4_9PROT|nr:hypothetical protein [Siccirubricoccus deserti]MBC4017435.1 hypothetical protein [Siccirubricoccus deserti]